MSSVEEERGTGGGQMFGGKHTALTERGVNRERLRIALQQAWRTIWEVKIESLGSNIFMFQVCSTSMAYTRQIGK